MTSAGEASSGEAVAIETGDATHVLVLSRNAWLATAQRCSQYRKMSIMRRRERSASLHGTPEQQPRRAPLLSAGAVRAAFSEGDAKRVRSASLSLPAAFGALRVTTPPMACSSLATPSDSAKHSGLRIFTSPAFCAAATAQAAFTAALPAVGASREKFLLLVKDFSRAQGYRRLRFPSTPRGRAASSSPRRTPKSSRPASRSGTPLSDEKSSCGTPTSAASTLPRAPALAASLSRAGGASLAMRAQRGSPRRASPLGSPLYSPSRGLGGASPPLSSVFGSPIPLALSVAQLSSIVTISQARKDLIREQEVRLNGEGECSFIYRYTLRESCSQFDSLPLTSLRLNGEVFAMGHAASLANIEGELIRQLACIMFAPRDSPAKLARSGAGLSPPAARAACAAPGAAERPLVPCVFFYLPLHFTRIMLTI